MSVRFGLSDLLARSTESAFEETTLSKALAGLPRLSSSGPWLAGGALRRTLLGQEPDSDFDFFFRDADQLLDFTHGLETRGLTKVRETEHHVHYRGRIGDLGGERDVQCIRFRYYQTADEVIDSFDFTVCMFAFDGSTLTAGDMALWDLGRKRLAVHKLTYPLASMRRLLKYGRQGFFACNGCLSTLLTETAERPELRQTLGVAYVD